MVTVLAQNATMDKHTEYRRPHRGRAGQADDAMREGRGRSEEGWARLEERVGRSHAIGTGGLAG